MDLMDSQTPETVEEMPFPDRGYNASDRREHRRHDVPHGVDVPGDARDDEIPRGRHSCEIAVHTPSRNETMPPNTSVAIPAIHCHVLAICSNTA